MSKPNPYINTFYLAVHFALNVLVVVLILNVIDAFIPLKHLFAGYHINLHYVYPPSTLQKNIAAALAVGAAVTYYYKRKAKHSDTADKYHLPSLRELEEFIRSKF
jgi:hypothetical protein